MLNKGFILHCLISLAFLLESCTDSEVSKDKDLKDFPNVIILDTLKGYSINPISGEKINPIMDSLNEEFPTGKNLKIRPKLLEVELKSPKQFALSPSRIVEQTSDQLKNIKPDFFQALDPSKMPKFNLTTDQCTLEIKNGQNIAVPINEEFEIEAVISSFINHKSNEIQAARYPDIVNYDMKVLGTKQGLSSDYIRTIFKDSKGKVWIATDGIGVDVYNGESIKTFNKKSGFPVGRVFDIEEDKHGNIWFAAYDEGLVKFDGQKFHHWNFEQGLPKAMCMEILVHDDGSIYIASLGDGLIRYHDDKFKLLIPSNEPYSKYVYSIDVDNDGRLWVGSGYKGLYSLKDSVFTFYSGENGISDLRIFDIQSDINEGIWLSTELGLGRIVNDSFTRYEEIPQFTVQNSHKLFPDKTGNIWFNMGNKTYQFNGNTFDVYDLKDGIIEGTNICVNPTIDNDIWVGTYGGGIKQINPGGFMHIDKRRNFSENIPISMAKDKAGRKWFGTNMGELIKQDANQYSFYEDIAFLDGAMIGQICADNEKGIWFTSWKNGLFYLHENQIDAYDAQSGFGNLEIYGLMSDSKNRLWISNKYEGLTIYDKGKLYRLSTKEGLPSDLIYTTAEDKYGNIWIASDGGGLWRYNNGNLKVFSEKEGLSSNFIRSIHFSGDSIWVGHATEGVDLIYQDSIQPFNENNGLISNTVWSITSDSKFGTWVGTEIGLSLIVKNQASSNSIPNILNFNHHDGLKANDFIQNSLINDEIENSIYWGTGKSLVKLDLDKFKLNREKPEILISDILINQKFIDFTQDSDSLNGKIVYQTVSSSNTIPRQIELEYDQNNIQFKSAAHLYSSKARLFYSYKLTGLNNEWSPKTKKSSVDYQNLKPGQYVFHVKAFNEAGISSEPLTVEFLIKPPLWESLWAKTLYLLIFLLIVYFTYKFQLKIKLEKAEAIRLKELDSFKSRFFANISHEFRTPLTIIKGIPNFLSADFKNGDKENFERHIDAVRRNGDNLLSLVDQILELSKLESKKSGLDEAVLDLNEITKSYLTAYDSLISTKEIQINFVPLAGGAFVGGGKKGLSYIIQNLLSNAIKYTEKGSITIRLSEEPEGQICFQITDTGKGISEENLKHVFDRFYQVQDSSDFEQGGFGIGLAITKEFIDLMNGKIEVESQVDKGTTFRVFLRKSKDNRNFVSIPEHEIIIRDSTTNNDEFPEEKEELPSILIVEDNKDMQSYLVELLRSDYSIILAENGKKGLEKAIAEVPDFIISDWMMPELNGPDMINLVKQNIACSHVPIMLLTARADEESRISGYKHGAEAYLSKPFNEEELKAQISNLISAKKKLRHFLDSSEPKDVEKVYDAEKEFIENSIALVEADLINPNLDGDWLASENALSRSQYARKLRAISGLSVTQFIRNIRLEKAKILLKENRLNISEIAYEVGFSDPSYFTRIFTKEVGLPPTEYK